MPPVAASLISAQWVAAVVVGVAACRVFAGCTSYPYNRNVKGACRTSDAAAPGVHVVTGAPGAFNPPAPPAASPR